jgi:hypothetical protein
MHEFNYINVIKKANICKNMKAYHYVWHYWFDEMNFKKTMFFKRLILMI